MKGKVKILFCLMLFFLVSCKTDSSKTSSVAESNPVTKTIPIPKFNAENAYNHIEEQISFGPRVPNSEGHKKCRAFIISELKSHNIKVHTQNFDAKGFEGTLYKGTNIIGSLNPDNPKRIILAAHWDTRFTADADPDNSGPSLQADDGGSGVGVLLEMARILRETPIELGVDLIFFDVEDQGESNGGENSKFTWGLGAQHWAKQPHIKNYNAKYGILLDMVGAKGAQFPKENVSGYFKPNIVRGVHQLYGKVWKLAKQMGRSEYFVDRTVNGGIDDHYFVNLYTNIPMIDIINKPSNSESSFGPHWHTHDDNMQIIDVATLKNVGQVVTAVVYQEEMGKF